LFDAPVVFVFKAFIPKALFLLPVVFADKASAPTAVFVATAPAPLPTVKPWIVTAWVELMAIAVVPAVCNSSTPLESAAEMIPPPDAVDALIVDGILNSF
jgi:hypothetical protein